MHFNSGICNWNCKCSYCKLAGILSPSCEMSFNYLQRFITKLVTQFCVWDHRENKFQFPDRGLFTAMNKHFPDEWCLLTQNTILLHIVKRDVQLCCTSTSCLPKPPCSACCMGHSSLWSCVTNRLPRFKAWNKSKTIFRNFSLPFVWGARV